jgi:hypothetical protein
MRWVLVVLLVACEQSGAREVVRKIEPPGPPGPRTPIAPQPVTVPATTLMWTDLTEREHDELRDVIEPGDHYDMTICLQIDRDGRVIDGKLEDSTDPRLAAEFAEKLALLKRHTDRVPLLLSDALAAKLAGRWLCRHAPPQNVPPTLLEGSRIAGDKSITPNAATRDEIRKSGKDKVVGTFKLCIDTTGAPISISKLKSTGFEGYDRDIDAGMKAWRYRPYLVNGKRAPVCTAVTFIYSAP